MNWNKNTVFINNLSFIKGKNVQHTLQSSPLPPWPPGFCLCVSLRWTASGGRGSTTTVSSSWFKLTRTAEDSRASQPWTTWPGPPAGLCLELDNKDLILPTRASSAAARPKTSLAAEDTEDKGGTSAGTPEDKTDASLVVVQKLFCSVVSGLDFKLSVGSIYGSVAAQLEYFKTSAQSARFQSS